MAKPNKRVIVKEYCSILEGELKKRFGSNVTLDNLVYHLVEKGIVRPTEVRRKVIAKDYAEFLDKHDGVRMRALYETMDRHDVTEMTVYKTLRRVNELARKDKNIK